MRLLMIEKKTAANFEINDGDTSRQHQHPENVYEEGEESPLLKTSQDQDFVFPSEQSRMMKLYPILCCFKDVRMLAAIWVTLVQAVLMGTFDATVPTVCEGYYEFDSLQANLMFIPILLPGLILGPFAGWITDRQGPKWIVTMGFGLLVPVIISLRMVEPGGIIQVLIYCIILTLCGTCLAVTNPPALVVPTLVIERYHKANPGVFGPNGPYGQISSITGMTYNAGTALGTLLAGALKLAIGYGNMNLATAALSLVTALLGPFYIIGKPVERAV